MSKGVQASLLKCEYEEVIEPRVVKFEATVTEINRLVDNLGNFYIFHDSMKQLAGCKVKVTCVEILEDL